MGRDVSQELDLDHFTTTEAVEKGVNAVHNGFVDVLGELGLLSEPVQDVVSAYQEASGDNSDFLNAWSTADKGDKEEVSNNLKGDGW